MTPADGIGWKDVLLDVELERDRYKAALTAIATRDWVENALDPQWAGIRAGQALAPEQTIPLPLEGESE